MHFAVLVGASLLATAPASPDANADTETYRYAASAAGRDAAAHVRLALWCEAHGMAAERLAHLARAVLIDPANESARGLMGLVPFQGRWQPPDTVAERVRNDARTAAQLAEYNALRAKAQNTADSQWALAIWCEKHGLKPEALAHFTAVTRLDPRREAAWKRLGCRRHNGRWMTDAEIAGQLAEKASQQKADKHWRPLLLKFRDDLKYPGKRDAVERELTAVNDPRAVRSVWSVFVARGGTDAQAKGIKMLGQIASAPATRALATVAVLAADPEIRRSATESVLGRDPREAIDLLIGTLRDPIRFEVKPVGGPGSPGALFVEGQQYNTQFVYAPPPLPTFQLQPGDAVQYDAFGLPVIDRHKVTTTRSGNRTTTEDDEIAIPVGAMILETQLSAVYAQRQLISDIAVVKQANARITEVNARVGAVLERATGQDFGVKREAWAAWWTDQQGYAYQSPKLVQAKPTFVQNVPLAFQPTTGASIIGSSRSTTFTRGHSCFGAGTLVRTLSGLRTIEEIRPGDEVLSQDPRTGALTYQPVLAVFHNSPNATLRIRLEDGPIVATGIHRFWLAGKGWTMARDLKPGERVRSLGATVAVLSVDADAVQPVFNLEVAGGHSYFVGGKGSLVHDNSLVQPTPAPFDAPPALAAVADLHEQAAILAP